MVGHKMWLTGTKGRALGLLGAVLLTDRRYWYIIWHRIAIWLGILIIQCLDISGMGSIDSTPCDSISAKLDRHSISAANCL